MDVKGLVIVLAGSRPQRLRSAGLINRRVFLELGENDLPVFSLEGAAHWVIDQRQQDDGAQGKEQGIPEAQANGEIAEKVIQHEVHRRVKRPAT